MRLRFPMSPPPGLPAALLSSLLLLAGLAGCSSEPPRDALKLSATSLANRQIQSRRFDTPDRVRMLTASASVLQDLGYVLDVSNADLGVLTASKELDATSVSQITGMILLALFTKSPGAYDDEQKVRVCVVVNESPKVDDAAVVRVTVSRVIVDNKGRTSKAESINEPALYQAFFAKLSAAASLEAHEI